MLSLDREKVAKPEDTRSGISLCPYEIGSLFNLSRHFPPSDSSLSGYIFWYPASSMSRPSYIIFKRSVKLVYMFGKLFLLVGRHDNGRCWRLVLPFLVTLTAGSPARLRI